MRAHTVSAALVMLALGGDASADGMIMHSSANVDVTATKQRALLWLRGAVWEIHIQPIFESDPGAATWVVPFPTRPIVHAGNADFFDQLELLTSPVFIKICYEPKCGDGDGGVGASRTTGEMTPIEVWEQGAVGDLDYVILSAHDGDSLMNWLQTEGFKLPAEAGALIGAFETEGQYFFCARLSPEADPDKPLTPVRFVLPDMLRPTYPLRLTGLGVPENGTFNLTLWVIFPKEEAFAPRNHPFGKLDPHTSIGDPDDYNSAVDNFFEHHSGETLLVQYAQRPMDALSNGRFCYRNEFHVEWISPSDLGTALPSDWCPEIDDIDSERSWVIRYQSRFDTAAMTRDFTMNWVDSVEEVFNAYFEYTGGCWECPGESDADGGGENTTGGGCGCGSSGTGLLACLAICALLVVRRVPGKRGSVTSAI